MSALSLEPCSHCGSRAVSLETPAGEARARGACASCGAKGPMAGLNDPRPWDRAAAEDWNRWSLASWANAGASSTPGRAPAE